MGRPKKINLNDLKQVKGNLEGGKPVNQVVAESKAAESTKEISATVEQKPEEKAYTTHGALSPQATENINQILKKFRRSAYDKYETTEQYSNAIKAMTLSELHAHSIDVNVIPTAEKEKLIKNLENAFGVHVNRNAPKVFPPANFSVQNAKNIEEIMAKKLGRKF